MRTYNGATKTIIGIKTKDVRFNEKAGVYQGLIQDQSGSQEKWVANIWNEDGSCTTSKYGEGRLLSPLN